MVVEEIGKTTSLSDPVSGIRYPHLLLDILALGYPIFFGKKQVNLGSEVKNPTKLLSLYLGSFPWKRISDFSSFSQDGDEIGCQLFFVHLSFGYNWVQFGFNLLSSYPPQKQKMLHFFFSIVGGENIISLSKHCLRDVD